MAIQKKTEGRDLDEYLQEVWDSLEPAWDKSKFDMKQGYDSEYECDCITITSKDNEGVLAKIYVNDYEGKHPVGFDVVYRYPGDKGVGVMGSYEFQSTDMDGLGEEVFDYFDEIKKKVGESKKSEADATFKVGDFVNYDAESDGDKLSTGWAFAEVVAVNDDGTLKLQPYNLEDYDEVDGVNPQFCEKMEHFAGMTDANTYYMDGKYNVYKGYYEIYVTTKELGKPYGFAGTLDSLDDVEQLMDYYDETMVYDQDIQDEVMSAVYGLTHYDEEDLKGINFADLSDKTESKKSEGLPPKKLGDRRYRSRADLINKMKQLGATEITTRDQYDELRGKQWLHKGGYAMDINGNLVGQTYFGDKDGKWYYASSKTFQGDYLPECKKSESKADGERAVDDYDTLIDGLEAFGFELSSSVRNGMFYPYRTRFTATKNGVKYGFTLNEDSTGEYLESIEVGGGIFDKGDPNDPDATKFNSVGDLLDALKKMDGKESEAKKSEAEGSLDELIDKVDNMFHYHNKNLNNYQYNTIDDLLEALKSKDTDKIKEAIRNLDNLVHYRNKNLNKSQYYLLDELLEALQKKYKKSEEAKKSESLTLKQKELKDMARFGQAEDITTISDEEAKALRKKGIETVGISRGTYGMNGALLRDNEGKKYVITARSSNLFYFV